MLKKLGFRKLLMVVVLMSAPYVVFAEEESAFSYDYIQASYRYLDMKTSTVEWHYDGYMVDASKSITDNVFLTVGYLEVDRKTSNVSSKLDGKFIGAGLNYPIKKDTDIVARYSHVKTAGKSEYRGGFYSSSYSSEGHVNQFSVGARYALLDDLELNASVERYDWAGDDMLYKGIKVGAVKNITNDISIVFDVAKLKDSSTSTADWTDYSLGARYHY